jgi:hypothetical protein
MSVNLSEILRVNITVSDDQASCDHDCLFFRMLGANGKMLSHSCCAFAPEANHTVQDHNFTHEVIVARDPKCVAMFGPGKSYADINGDFRYSGPGSETATDPVAEFRRRPKLRMPAVDASQLNIDFSKDPTPPDEAPLFSDEADSNDDIDGGTSDADLGLDNSTEAQYPDAPAHKDGKWRWWTREQPRDGERVEAYGFEFTTKHRSVTPLSFKGVVIQHMDDDDKIASGIASHNGHGALLHDPNIHIEIVCWKPQTRVGRPSTKAK